MASARPLKRKPITTTDRLAKDLAKLNIRGKKDDNSKSEANKVASMRAVNAALQSLSNVVQSGWKKSSGTSRTLDAVTSSANEAAKHIAVLRRISPQDVDVERAALSILGKLILLETDDHAMSALVAMHPRLCLAVDTSQEHLKDAKRLYFVSIPMVASPPSDHTLLNLLSTYLLYALMLATRPKSSTPESVQELSITLDSPSTFSLLSWFPVYSLLPSKHLDSIFTRAYTALNKLCNYFATPTKPLQKLQLAHSSTTSLKEALFSLRVYALCCLAHTSEGVVEGKVFWDQATKFTAMLVKSTTSVPSFTDDERFTTLVLLAFDRLVGIAEARPDKESFMGVDEKNSHFLAFLDYWSSFAKKAGDICVLQRINALMQKSSSPSLTMSPREQAESNEMFPAQHSLIMKGTKICNTFSQLSLLLEDVMKTSSVESANETDDQLLSVIKSCISHFEESSTCHFLRSKSDLPEDGELDRICAKVDRAMERARRLTIKAGDIHTTPTISLHPNVVNLLHSFLRAYVGFLRSVFLDPILEDTILHRSIDTLFFLARVTLKVTDPRTFIPAFELLSQTTAILNSVPSSSPRDNSIDIANYTRCVSGAFYNLARILYQGMRYGNAVPFLLESCTLGERALSLSRSSSESMMDARSKEWKQHEEQLYFRWEVLGTCYSKNHDRRKAFDAFKRAIVTFPFSSTPLSEQTERLAIDMLFGPDCEALVKQLVGLVDRVTYIGACELFLPFEEISLRSCLRGDDGCFHIDDNIRGALLEQQIISLKSSQWKDCVRDVMTGLLKDALEIYSTQGHDGSLLMPIRRTRTILRCLDFVYRHFVISWISSLGYGSVEDMVTEIESLCTQKSFAKDSSLAHFKLQYQATGHLFAALHAHRRADPEQNTIMTQRTEEAYRLMKLIVVPGNACSSKLRRGAMSPKPVQKGVRSVRAGRIVSPKTTRMTKLRVPAAPKKPTLDKRAKVVGNSRSVNSETKLDLARRQSSEPKTSTSDMVFDNFDDFLQLLHLVARILGMLSLILAKAHMLDIARKLAYRQLGAKSDGYILASLDLAHEYMTLGKPRRAFSIFSPALDVVRDRRASQEVSVRFLLRFAESLAIAEDIPKSLEVYLEAQDLHQQLDLDERGTSTQERIVPRAKKLEMAATAAHVFATIQFRQGDSTASLEYSLQSLRLWNRAVDVVSRLRPATSAISDSNPFDSSPQNSVPSMPSSRQTDQPSINVGQTTVCELEWCLSEGLLSTLLALNESYFLRGSPREAEYFARKAVELTEQLNTPAMASRAFARLAEVQMHMSRLEDAHSNLTKATELLHGMPGLDAADIRRLEVEYQKKKLEGNMPMEIFDETVTMLEDLEDAFLQFDCVAFGSRTSFGSPGRKMQAEVLAPTLFSSILSQQLWLLRNEIGDQFDKILKKFLSLSWTNETKAEENALMGNLTLHSVYGRFQADMFLSSFIESTIAVPIGMKSKSKPELSISSLDIFEALVKAEKHLSAHLDISASTGSIIKIRDTLISLVLVYAFRTSLGDRREELSSLIAALLDASASLSLRHDMVEAIDHKYRSTVCADDLVWPLPRSDPSDSHDTPSIEGFWRLTRQSYQKQIFDPFILSSCETATLPSNWTVVNISVTSDKSTLLCCRREGGDDSTRPLIFCIPLKGRRDPEAGDEEGSRLTFEGVTSELQDIINASNESTKFAIHIKSDDEEARSNWWKNRGQLDNRMRDLLENIEYCWLGAFKTILSPRSELPVEKILELRDQFEKVFHQNLSAQDRKKAKTKHKKSTYVPGQFGLDETFVKCFSTLSPDCRNEELEDIVYFVLDLYQYHGIPVAVSEIDIDQIVVDLRSVLEKYSTSPRCSTKRKPNLDEHLFLILDKNVQGIPWESLPILRGRSVSRIPGVQFLHDRILFARRKREAAGRVHNDADGAFVDPLNGYFILNPSGDLRKTEERFRGWANGMRTAGWDGVIGEPLIEQHFIDVLKSKDLVIYFGHGGGEQYVRSHRIRNLPTCAATMLWGCSSGALRDLGDFDRSGTPYNYMLAGCPTLVANLWDVTDKDIDTLCMAVLNKMSLNGGDIGSQTTTNATGPTSLVSAVAQSRDSCKLKYLTGAAPIVYGIPFYL